MDMTAEAMQKTLDISRPETHEIEDVNGIRTTFSTKTLFQIKAAAPEEPSGVAVSTLAGFADLIRAGLEGKDFPQEWMIHVQDEKRVSLKVKTSDKFGRRLTLIEAQPVSFRQFQFGQWYTQEEFAIAVASLFAESPDKDYVLRMASTLTNEVTTLSEDDGFSQKATTKAGMRLKEAITIKPKVAMAPYRTFPEVDQPVSEFVLRARCGDGASPSLMLIEADGGRWKVDAIAKISAAMKSFDLNIPIIA